MKKVVSLALVLAALGWTAPAFAKIGTIDNVPAATLLAPYFEVDLNSLTGVNTLISINNATAGPALAQIILYSDLSVPTMAFNLYLTGYDVQTISVRDLFNGVLPQTADLARDPGDTLSPKGPFSAEISFPVCGGPPALLPPSPLAAGFTAHLAAAHTGQSSTFLGGCAGQDLGDGIARGYIVVNTLTECTLAFPNDPGYFAAGGTGLASNANVLWGDVFYVDSANNFAQGKPLVHIEASGTDPETSLPGEYTFFGRYVAWDARDNREPLATNFAVRFINGAFFDGGTDLIVWRDSKVSQAAFACPTRPPWYPLGQEAVVIFDEQEQPDIIPSIPVGPQPPFAGIIPFPAEANRTKVNGAELPVPFDFGWLYLNLNTTVAVAGADPPEDPAAAQAWVSVIMDAEGRFSVGFEAIQLDSAANATHGAPGSFF